MDRAALVHRYRFFQEKQNAAALRYREYASAGFPLLAKPYQDECKYCGVLMLDSVAQPEELDRAEGRKH